MGCINSRLKYEEKSAALGEISSFVHRAIDGKLDALAKDVKKNPKVLHATDRFGMTALHWVCYAGKMESVMWLCDAGAVPTQTDNNQRNALHHACRRGRLRVVEYLIRQRGMNINTPRQWRYSAAQSRYGILDDTFDESHSLPVLAPSAPVVLFLLQEGADKTLPNGYGRSSIVEVKIKLGKMKLEATTIPSVAEDHEIEDEAAVMPKPVGKIMTFRHMSGAAAPVADSTTAVLPFSSESRADETLHALTPAQAKTLASVWETLTGYDFLEALFELHDRVLAQDQDAIALFHALVVLHVHV
ncbi:Aste57867_11889 [Aphanomyces stellatus]|uniref:Aste57867_11889 protein n=1 Tax=Aphanomyces stellatus TaxID=120398 RepID=A0A485KUM4_9STRA|nr:hypothetical protein As57867_011844 [Aphanomyces stellatus]VFT88744.1 Aste57867_11889 [Aphanomyces stellatus]